MFLEVAGVADVSYLHEPDAGKRIYARCEEWAKFSAHGPGVTRFYLSHEHRLAAETLMGWMRDAGMEVWLDAAGNVVGRYHSSKGGGPYLVMGSHQDSVVHGGKYDGPLGIITALDCVAVLNAEGKRFPYGIEVVAFGDEEGARFRTTLAGSRAIVGEFGDDLLQATDADGVNITAALESFGLDPRRVEDAAHRPEDVVGWVEVHIEQGPVLESEDLPIGVVTGISAQRRAWFHFRSEPNHAGTVPMHLRADALAAAAEAVLIIEKVAASYAATVGTVGSVTTQPGVVNVICGQVTISLDLRSSEVETLRGAYETIISKVSAAACLRGVEFSQDVFLDLDACPCSPEFVAQLEAAVRETGHRAILIPSGAGHDAMAMSRLTEIGMLFVRCKGGISHNPAESVTVEDVAVGAHALMHFVRNFRPNSRRTNNETASG